MSLLNRVTGRKRECAEEAKITIALARMLCRRMLGQGRRADDVSFVNCKKRQPEQG